jgi:CubicO group peptidase (beta-lactamase class C family)
MKRPGPLFPPVFGSALALGILAQACTDTATWPEPVLPAVPAQLHDGWSVGTLPDAGLDPDVISVMDLDIRTGRIGKLVYERYVHPATGVDKLHPLASVTKSVLSMAVGAAVQQGLITGPDQPIRELLPQYAGIFLAEPEKGEITLRDVLTMTSGLAWDDKHPSSRERDGVYIYAAPDAGRYVLEKPLLHKPGTRFHYSGGDTQLLATILTTVGGEEAGSFTYHQLLRPVSVEDHQWARLGDGSIDAAGGLSLRARDLAVLGQLYLGEGEYLGSPIVTSRWVEDSFHPWTSTDKATLRYGFQWWMCKYAPLRSSERPYGLITASGFGGQKLFIVPDLDLVVVFFGCTSEGYACGISDQVPEQVMYNYILRAVR